MHQIIGTSLILLMLSCAGKIKEEKFLAWENWKGHSSKELETHPYFKNLSVKKIKHKNGLETWVLLDQSRYQSEAYCQSLGGCMGMPIYNCSNAFSVKDHVILGFDQSGTCPDVKTIDVRKK